MADTRIALLGAGGRMGQAIREALPAEAGVRVAAAVVRKDSPLLGQPYLDVTYSSDLNSALATADVLLDFSVPVSTLAALDACIQTGTPMVIGVTGLDVPAKGKIHAAGTRIPVLVAPNMSLGVALLMQLATAAAKTLGADFDIEITEAHHRHKRDAPSGTALALAEAMAVARDQPLQPRPVGPRPAGSIGFAVVRAGDIVGEHTVLFAGKGERLELSHRAGSRLGFARGALKAAVWLRQQPAGVYELTDMLRTLK